MPRFDAVLFDAGGVLVLPDPLVLAPLLAYFGGDPSLDSHRRAHYAGMKAKSDIDAGESSWDAYNDAYVAAVGVDEDDRAEAAEMLDRTRYHATWRWVIPESRAALDRLAECGVPMGVVSNASGQIEAMLAREICQVGPGDHIEMRVIVDSELVGVAKPDPRIFDHALPAFDGFDRSRIAYVGDSVTMDIGAGAAAGLHPILLDPYDHHPEADFERIRSLDELVAEFG
ncbi:HAD family hydrolase [Ilumatobacter nonamiensis]|uniref:HAD family hydrolase n=1 Tax=Ilumatobacter nonamiensis TaxID=467093 RepID=UPI0003491FFF|nr:HAD family hydrolase [Ilumatobacter nonamiensis]